MWRKDESDASASRFREAVSGRRDASAATESDLPVAIGRGDQTGWSVDACH